MKQNLNTTFVFTTDQQDTFKPILGFYTLATSALCLKEVPPHLAKHVPPTYSLPTARIGRLARDLNYPGIGPLLLKDAIEKILTMSKKIGIYGIEVDAKNEKARNFYQKYGFISLIDELDCLFMPIKTLQDVL